MHLKPSNWAQINEKVFRNFFQSFEMTYWSDSKDIYNFTKYFCFK